MTLRCLCASLAAAACAPWSHGGGLSPDASGLIGAWIAPQVPGLPDTTVLRFGADGTVAELRLEPSGDVRTSPWGPFRTYPDSGTRRLLCFAFRRSRSQSACRYYRVLVVADTGGRTRRQLHLLSWVGDNRPTPEVWTERASP